VEFIADAFSPEEHDTEETCFKEDGTEHFVAHYDP